VSESIPEILIAENGPYIVYSAVPLSVEKIVADDKGTSKRVERTRSFEAREKTALCRCGHSSNKPYCDGAHAREGFDGTETASKAGFDEQAETIDGPVLVLQDAKPLCSWARFCDDGKTIWTDIAATDDAATRELVAYEAGACPSGRLVVREKATGALVEPHFEREIALLEDPVKDASGPIVLRGGFTLTSADGSAYEVRNRMALCRCGASANKPFCDGSHVDVAFHDGL
jgi:CDGSH-type Zn-finger protein